MENKLVAWFTNSIIDRSNFSDQLHKLCYSKEIWLQWIEAIEAFQIKDEIKN